MPVPAAGNLATVRRDEQVLENGKLCNQVPDQQEEQGGGDTEVRKEQVPDMLVPTVAGAQVTLLYQPAHQPLALTQGESPGCSNVPPEPEKSPARLGGGIQGGGGRIMKPILGLGVTSNTKLAPWVGLVLVLKGWVGL